ncbi:MAG TPA: ferritin-like domain-containing protein [Spongiibacteraceae bacterium]|jgi:rubrerythrin
MSILPAGYPSNQPEALQLLATRQHLSIDDMKVLAMIEAAGEALYLGLADVVDNAEAKALLARNGHEERGHAHRLLKALALLGVDTFTLPADAQNPFITPIRVNGKLSVKFLEIIEKGEIEGDLQYQAWADAEPNAEVAKLYRQNGGEETRHSERVTRVKQLLSA